MAVFILRPGLTQVHTNTPVQKLHFRLGVAGAINSAQAHKTASVDQLLFYLHKPVVKGGQREVFRRNVHQIIGFGEG